MTKKEAKERIFKLTDLINKYRREYYELDSPSISDFEYDSLIRNLEELEKEYPEYAFPNSPTKLVGYVASNAFEKVRFKNPMLSLADIFSYDEVKEFYNRIISAGFSPTFVCELKIDGIASSIYYESGFLKLASTRGNGLEGENITENVKTIDTLPKVLHEDIDIEVYAAPYSYVYSEEEGVYKLGFSHENNFTQLVRWISFVNSKGEWVRTKKYKVPAHGSTDVKYKITTPNNIPAGGQDAVIFAHTLTGVISANGIKTEASPGMVIYGRSTEGEVKMSAEISDMKVGYGTNTPTTGMDGVTTPSKDGFSGSAKVKNSGNVDFSAVGKLKVESILGFGGYETPADRGRISVIPESELEVSDAWEDTPAFGLYKATWTVTAGDSTETVETVVFVNPLPAIIITIIVLTIITIWIIMVVRKRKERSSRLAVQESAVCCEQICLYEAKINIKYKQECRV